MSTSSAGQQRRRRGLRHRDRRGRGMRGRLVPPTSPLSRSRAQQFDDLVLDAVDDLERRWPAELKEVEFAVEDVPPELPDFDSDVVEDGSVPLARLLQVPGRATDAPPRIVLYRRPLEARALDRDDLGDLVHDVVVEQVAHLLGKDPDDVDPPPG
ncbi:MAG: metallopeptidase family protein [Pseudonocardiales bacterium]